MIAFKAAQMIMVSAILLALAACAETSGEADQLATAPVRVDAADHSEDFSSARGYLDTGQYGFAVTRIEAFLVKEPTSAKGQALAGVIYDHIGRFDLADHHYKLAIELDPGAMAAKNNYALSKLQWAQASGRIELANEAMALLDQAAALDETNTKLQRNRQEAQQVIAELQARQAAQQPVAAPAEPVTETFAPAAWLERRAANYTFVVTTVSASMADAITRLHLDPAVAMVSPGVRYADGTLPAAHERLPVVTRLASSTAKTQWLRNLPRMLFARASAKGKMTPLTLVIHDALIDARGKGRPSRAMLSGRVERLLVMASIW